MPALVEHVRYVHARDGTRIALTEVVDERQGAGPTFLLIHGFAQNRQAFLGGDLPRFLVERGARVLLGELRGHGRSDAGPRGGAPRDWSLATHLEEDLPALIEHAISTTGAPRIHLMGHSMGGLLGYALLARGAPLASLTTFAAPVMMGRERWLMRLAALAVAPVVRVARPGAVPIDRFLRAIAPLLTHPEATGVLWLLQELTRLVNPKAGDARALHDILASSDPESPSVFVELAEAALFGRKTIAGVDLAGAIANSELPIAAVIGPKDVFASRAGVACLRDPGARGPRLVLEVPEALHVDLIAGHHAEHLIRTLWNFLLSA